MNWITQKEANELIYEGNSISYIYTKMKCYSDQVGMAYDALRKLGFDTSLPNGNKEMKNALILFVEQQNQLEQRNKELTELLRECLPTISYTADICDKVAELEKKIRKAVK